MEEAVAALTPGDLEYLTQDQVLENSRKRRAWVACDLLLARLFLNHPQEAGVTYHVRDVDLDPEKNNIVVLPVQTRVQALTEGCPPINLIIEVVASFYECTPNDIKSQRRTCDVIKPRQVAMYLAKELTTKSMPQIGAVIGDRDHTTVLHGYRKIAKQLKTNERLKDEIDLLQMRLRRAQFASQTIQA